MQGNYSAIQATNRQVLIDTISGYVNIPVFAAGIAKGNPFLCVEIQGCGKADYMTIEDIPYHSVPCPCGNPKHWLIKYDEEPQNPN